MHTPSNPPTATQRLAARLILDNTPGTAADEERKVIHTTRLQGGKILTVIRYPQRGRLERAVEGPFVTGEGPEPEDGDMFQAIADAYQAQADSRGERLAIYWQMERGQKLSMTFEPRRATNQSDKPAPVSKFAVLDDFIAEMRQSIREALSKKSPAQLVAHFERFPADFIFCSTP